MHLSRRIILGHSLLRAEINNLRDVGHQIDQEIKVDGKVITDSQTDCFNV
jgi:hypothetical protein